MKYYSTNHRCAPVSFREAVLKGLAEDGGLFLPESIPALPTSFFDGLPSLSLPEIALTVSSPFMGDELPAGELKRIIDAALNFDAPLKPLAEGLSVLELFHGPTLAFKDFAARFMAGLMATYVRDSNQELTVLVATSGDTGSAVARGFHGMPGIRVFILYPSGKVSFIQERQLTTMGANIAALEIDGTFDDCQRLVKSAFLDADLVRSFRFTSANSINIARLIPQSFYYFYAAGQVTGWPAPVVFSVPSGNFGNITAGVLAKRMGLPVVRFIAAVNSNDTMPNYLETGRYQAQETRLTLSNAMDVGNPSNFARILDLYRNDADSIRRDFWSASIADDETRQTIREAFDRFGYVFDPHGAVGYAAWKRYRNETGASHHGIVLETAHPAKFPEIVEPVIGQKIRIPERLEACLEFEKKSTKLTSRFEDLKNFLFGTAHHSS
jgi:threonine synthase